MYFVILGMAKQCNIKIIINDCTCLLHYTQMALNRIKMERNIKNQTIYKIKLKQCCVIIINWTHFKKEHRSIKVYLQYTNLFHKIKLPASLKNCRYFPVS